MKFNFVDLSPELIECVEELAPILNMTMDEEGFAVKTKTIEKGLTVEFFENEVVLGYEKPVMLFRAIGLMVEHFFDQKNVSEIPQYKDLSIMYDNSRNAVMNIATIKKAIRHIALMGYTAIMIYTEDTYELEGYPYFGYMRGRFTKEELKEIDAYAARFGLEAVPCIQTLAHLAQALRWSAFSEVHDCEAILLVGEEKTYTLIETMFRTMRECFKSTRINIGMDEAWMLGYGKYFTRNGYRKRWDILCEHLTRVCEIAEKYGFSPMMWSDMYFSAAFGSHYYYAATLEDPHLPQEIIDTVPKNVSVIYWDYSSNYPCQQKMLALHNEFNNDVYFAGGATKWAGYAPMNQFSIMASRNALQACRQNNIDRVMVTAWGDNGAECSNLSVFPTLQMYAEDCYENNTSDEFLAKRFRTCVNADYEDFLLLDTINFTPGNPAPGCGSRNPCKYLLHQDVLIGLFDKHMDPETFPKFFAERAEVLREAGKRNAGWSYLFNMLASLSDVLAVKTDVGYRLKKAYDEGDTDAMRTIADVTIPEIQNLLEVFIEEYRRQWLTENKVFGLEVIEVRLGGLERRLKSAIIRINAYLDGSAPSLPELEEERLTYDCDNTPGRNPSTAVVKWGGLVSGSPVDYI